ncbi:MAG: ABC transporter ATP-binding protein [Lachnospiraceae bacterium]|nr:ABC transporter ATP-binding protein [Lachnospiraceae bacterium]
MDELLRIENLSKKYGSKTALDRLDLTVGRGHIVGLLGPNGSGKTTLIKLIAGLLTASEGKILVNGNTVGVESKKVISYLPDTTYLNMNQTVDEVIKLFKTFYADFDENRAKNMLAAIGIETKTRLKTMSKGTKEKVQLILVMSRRADLYILDEPIAGVDPATRDYVLNIILSNYDPNASIIISTHLISDIEKILDQVVFIKNGKIERFGNVDDIREKEGKSIDALFREVFKC